MTYLIGYVFGIAGGFVIGVAVGRARERRDAFRLRERVLDLGNLMARAEENKNRAFELAAAAKALDNK